MFYFARNEENSSNNILAEDYFHLDLSEPLYPLNLLEFHNILPSAISEPLSPFHRERQRQTEYIFQPREEEREILKEIKSKNENFIQEKNIKYNLYPLYINWKKIETKSENNTYYNIFKLFGYFGEAIFNLLNNIKDADYFNHKNFLNELNSYNKIYTKSEIMENEFFKKIISIYDDVISLIKNRIIIFKEISVFLIIMRLYEKYYSIINDNDKVIEVLKYEFSIIYHIKDDEYKKIYVKYYKKFDDYSYDYDDDSSSISSSINSKFPKSKSKYINYIRSIYKKINRNNKIKIKKEN